MLFEKDSTRTRCSFDVGAMDLGMGVTYLGPTGSQMGKKESIADTARVLGRMYDGIEYRGFSQSIVEELATYAGVPVWNGLTDEFHPTQMIADLLTIEEKFGRLKGINFVYMGDARNNLGNSLMVACAKMGLNFTACAPKELFPSDRSNRYTNYLRRLDYSVPSITIDTGHRVYFHPTFNRVPTVRESARIQSFSDSFIITGTKGQQLKQVGNAVPPLMAKALAKAIILDCGISFLPFSM